ncbi:ATP-binding cassette domain-containing protein [Glaciecola sp. 1036]|uniref:ATP-binding cassette domain-containing protein n=1 Tax=Alteromonadaceae TaxID=72275 RepID=UPI003D07CED5
MPAFLSATNLTLNNRLDNISVHFKPGEYWHLLGANGSGKSSLLQVLSGLENDFLGEVLIQNKRLSAYSAFELSDFYTLVTQHYESDFGISVKEAFEFFNATAELPEEVEKVLQVKILLNKPLKQLSGGERQRVHLARNINQVWPSLKNGQGILLLDEPTQQLDPYFQVNVLNLLKYIVKLGNLVVQSHHDVNQTLNYADKVILLDKGKVFRLGETDKVVTPVNMTSLYNQEFREIADPSLAKGYLLVN